MSEYTPGPWHVKPVKRWPCHADILDPRCLAVASIWEMDLEANARLIAAAPTMLKALREAKVAMEQSGIADHLEWPYTYKSVVDAIATAEGENEH